jgi:ferric-dicitrate binding protein FerR (iron transport regulator)
VAAYGGGEVLSTTLYKGSVEVAVGEESILITPGTVASLDNSGELSVHEALTDAPSLWRSGVIILDEEDLTTVMHTLARHYDIDVVTESRRIGQYTFTGRIDCNKPIEEILSTLTQLGGPCFRVEDNTVYITSRN